MPCDGKSLHGLWPSELKSIDTLMFPFILHIATNQFQPNLAGIVLVWSPFKFVSDSSVFYSRWLLLLKIEISLIVYCCFIIGQNEQKFSTAATTQVNCF
jgi:hypothetical protein